MIPCFVSAHYVTEGGWNEGRRAQQAPQKDRIKENTELIARELKKGLIPFL